MLIPIRFVDNYNNSANSIHSQRVGSIDSELDDSESEEDGNANRLLRVLSQADSDDELGSISPAQAESNSSESINSTIDLKVLKTTEKQLQIDNILETPAAEVDKQDGEQKINLSPVLFEPILATCSDPDKSERNPELTQLPKVCLTTDSPAVVDSLTEAKHPYASLSFYSMIFLLFTTTLCYIIYFIFYTKVRSGFFASVLSLIRY